MNPFAAMLVMLSSGGIDGGDMTICEATEHLDALAWLQEKRAEAMEEA